MKKSIWTILLLGFALFSTVCMADVNDDLIEAVDDNDVEGVSQAVSAGANVNSFSKFGESALNKAIFEEDIEIIGTLIKNGADVNMTDSESDFTPLMNAVIGCTPDVVELLIKSGAALNTRIKQGDTALNFAEKSGCIHREKMILMLREAGAE